MPLTLTGEKEQSVLADIQQKAELVSRATFEKQQKAGLPASALMQKLDSELARVRSIDDAQFGRDYTLPEETLPEAFGRGVKEAVQSVPMLAYGVAAGAGAVAESMLGEGGFSTQFKTGAVKKYVDAQEEMAAHARPEDSLTYAFEKARQGDFGAMVSWASHGSGYVSAQLGTMLAGGGVIGKGTEVLGKKAISQVMAGLVRKEAGRIASRTGKKAASDAVMKAATKNITEKIGQQVGMASMSFGMEGGEIMGDLARQSAEKGEPLSKEQIGRGLTATALAGAVEYMETILNLNAFKGKLGNIPGTRAAGKIDGLKGKAVRGGVAGANVSAAESVQEYVQTGIEQWGKGQDLTSAHARQERFDAAGLGALGGGHAVVGGALTRSENERARAAGKQREKKIANPETAHNYKEQVAAAAASGDISGISDVEKGGSPLAGMDALHQRARKQDLSSLDRLKTWDDARALYQQTGAQTMALMEEAEKLDARREKDGELGQKDLERYEEITARTRTMTTVLKKMKPLLQDMNANEAPDPEALNRIKAVMEENNSAGVQDIVREVFGSNGGVSFLQEDAADLGSLMKTAELDAPTTQLVKRLAELQSAARSYTGQDRSAKGSTQVQSDIIYGNTEEGFMGLTQHFKGIGIALASGDVELAAAKQANLDAWAADRKNRARVFTGLYNAAVNGETPSKALQQGLAAINTKQRQNGLQQYNIHKGSRGLVNNVLKEAGLADRAAKAGRELLNATLPGKQTHAKGNVANAISPLARPDTTNPGTQTSAGPERKAGDARTSTVKQKESHGKKTGSKTEAKTEAKTGAKTVQEQPAPETRPQEKKGQRTETRQPRTPKTAAVRLRDHAAAREHNTVVTSGVAAEQVAKRHPEETRAQEPVQDLETGKIPGREPAFVPMNRVLTTSETDLDATDRANLRKINPVREFGRAVKQKTPSIFNRVPSVKEFMSFAVKAKNTSVEQGALASIATFQDKFAASLDGVFKYKGEDRADFFYEDPAQYFALDGKLPENVVAAMSTVAYRWLGSEAGNTIFNNAENIQRILGVPSSTHLDRNTQDLLARAGNTADYLGESLGREVFRYLQIALDENAPVNLQNKIERSLGLLMLANMQRMGHLKRTYVDYGTFGKVSPGQATTGLKGLANYALGKHNHKIQDNEFFVENIKGRHRNGRKLIHFFALKTDNTLKPSREIAEIRDHFRAAKGTWDALFGLGKDPAELSFTKIKVPEQMELTRSRETASEAQTANLKNNMDTPYVAAGEMMNIMFMLDAATREALAGAKEKTFSHADNDVRIDGVNSGIHRSLENVETWIAMAREKGFDSEFFIPEIFQASTRMRQTGTIQPQNDKIHRNLFSMKETFIELDPGDETLETPFLEAIGLAFGKEASKETRVAQAVKKTKDFLAQPDVQAGLAVVDQLLDQMEGDTFNPDLTAEGIDTAPLRKAVNMGGKNLHSLKGLVEYQKYVRAKAANTVFKTDIYAERDGRANGPVMMTLQLRTSDISADLLGRLMSGGLSFAEDPGPGDHKAAYDPYESIGAAWGNIIATMRKDLISRARARGNSPGGSKETRELSQVRIMDDISDLLGGLYNQDGHLVDTVRKLAKNMSVGAVYGAEKKSTVAGLVDHIIEEKIYGALEELAKTGDAEARVGLFELVNRLSGEKNSFFQPDRPADQKKDWPALTARLTPEAEAGLRETISQSYGEALYGAVTEVYGDFKEASKPLNRGIGILAARYNAAMRILLGRINGPVTRKQLAEIHEILDPVLPRVKTPLGGYVALYDFAGAAELPAGDDTQVKQAYQNSGNSGNAKDAAYLAGMTVEARDIKMLKAPGVKPIPTIIHMLDATVANQVMGAVNGIGILNIHDAAITGVEDAHEVSLLQNEAFFNTMKNYSVAGAVQDAMTEAGKAFKELDLGVAQAQIDKAIYDAYRDFGYHRQGKALAKKIAGLERKKDWAGVNKLIETRNWSGTGNGDGVVDIVKKTRKNKEILVEAVTRTNQYFDYRGGYPTGNPAQKKIGDVPVDAVVALTAGNKQLRARYNIDAQMSLEEMLATLASSPDSDLTLDPADYALEREINGKNAVSIYERIKNNSTKQDNAEHDAHLKRVLGRLVSNVLRPLDAFMKVNPYAEAEGVFESRSQGRNRIFISSQAAAPVSGALNQGIRMSTGEVYTHELLHAVLHSGLKNNAHLRDKVGTLYRLAYKRLGPDGYKVFLNDPAVDVTDPANQYEVQAAKDRYDYIFQKPAVTRKKERNAHTGVETVREFSNHLDEFITFGLTNENFMKALEGISLDNTEYARSTWAGLKGANIQETLMNIGQRIFAFFRATFTDIPGRNMAGELENLAFQLSRVESSHKSRLFETARKYTGVAGKISSMGNRAIKASFEKTGVPKIARNLKTAGQALKENPNALGQSVREVMHTYAQVDKGLAGVVKSTIAEVRGRTDRLADLYQLLSRRKLFLDAAKETAAEAYRDVARQLFNRELSAEEKAVLTRAGLRTDLSVLLDHLGEEGLLAIFKDRSALQSEITGILEEIRNDPVLGAHKVYYERAASALGHFMVHGRSRTDEVVFLSPRVIAELKNTKEQGRVKGQDADRAEELVDKLASLYAVFHVSGDNKAALAGLMQEDMDAVAGMLRMHKALKADALKTAFNGNKYLFRKGYTKQILNTETAFQYGTEAERAALEAAGFTMSKTPLERDPLDPTGNTKIYLYTAKTGRANDLLSTIMSFTRNRAAGTDSRQVAMQMDMDTHAGARNKRALMASKQHVLNHMADPGFSPGNATGNHMGNHMVPRLDAAGNIAGYRYMMAESTKDSFLEQVNDFDAVLGAMAGQIVDKGRTPVVNRELVTVLKGMYDREFAGNPRAFAEISAFSADPELRELWYMLPGRTKKDVKQIWGNNGVMMVPKDVLPLAFGYRKYSMVESFTKDPSERKKLEQMIVGLFNLIPGTQGIVAANNAEKLAGELTRLAKDNIIVKSLTVTLGNFGSNIMYLKARGVGFGEILKYGREALIMGTRYQADEARLNQLEIKRGLLVEDGNAAARIRDIDNEILQLKDALARNPVTTSVKSGLMPSLVDDVDMTGSQNYFPGMVESTIEKAAAKLPPVVRKAGNIVFLTQDTQAYKVLNNAVKMTDFVGRHVLYHHYVKTRGMDPKEAAASAIDEFVNFDVPTHRMTEYLNQIGILWFSKYATRIIKSVAGSIKDKPFDAAMSVLMSSHLGFDSIYASVPFVTSDVGNKISTPITALGASADDPVTLSLLGTILR